MSNEILESPHGTRYIFSLNPGLLIEEKEVTPFGAEGGEWNDLTTHRNVRGKTKAPKYLVDFTNPTATVSYATAALPQIMAMINMNQQITIQYNDGSSHVFWGGIKNFLPQSMQADGEQPTATMELVVSNRNASKVETLPSYSATGGLTTTTSTTLTTTTAAP